MGLFPVHVLAHTAGKNHRVVALDSAQGWRQPEAREFWSRALFLGEGKDSMRHVIRQRFDLRLSHAVANLPLESNLPGQRLAARLEHTNGTGVLGSDQP